MGKQSKLIEHTALNIKSGEKKYMNETIILVKNVGIMEVVI